MGDPRIKENDLLKAVIDLAHTFGWMVAHFRPAMNARGQWMTAVQGDGAGFPDLVLVRGLHIKFVELKGPKGRLTEAQEKWLQKLGEASKASAYAMVYVWKPSDWPAIVKVLR